MLLAQFTDMHVKPKGTLTFGHVDTAAHLAACVAHVNALAPRPDAVVITGDLTNDGRPEEYAALRELLAPLTMPYYLIPGNHDQRNHLSAAFSNLPYLTGVTEFVHYVVDAHPVRLIALDTTEPGQPGGRLCGQRLAWLEARLGEAPQKPTIIFMHHPPFATGIEHMDAMALADPAPLAAIVQRFPNVERVLCGHLHRPIQLRWAGTIALTAPATAHQVALGLTPGAPSRWRMEPPAVLLHLWRPDTGVVSHTSYIQDFGPARPFSDNHTSM